MIEISRRGLQKAVMGGKCGGLFGFAVQDQVLGRRAAHNPHVFQFLGYQAGIF